MAEGGPPLPHDGAPGTRGPGSPPGRAAQQGRGTLVGRQSDRLESHTPREAAGQSLVCVSPKADLAAEGQEQDYGTEADVCAWEPVGEREAAVPDPPMPDVPGKEAARSSGHEGTNLPDVPLRDCSVPPGAWWGLCTWQCWHQRVLEHLVQERTPESPSRIAQVTFEDVAVYFSPGEWAELAAWQKALYWDVMKENHALVASLVPAHDSPQKVLCRIAQGEAPPSENPLGGKRETASQDPGLGGGTAAFSSLHGTVSRDGADVAEARSQPEAVWACWKTDSEEPGAEALAAPSPADRSLCSRDEKVLGVTLKELKRAPPHDCQACGQSFPERDVLISHVLRAHFGERAWPCLDCGKLFGAPGSLAVHQTTHHQGPRLFACSNCKSSFVYSEQEAGRIHTQLAPGQLFRCFDCRCHILLTLGQKPNALHGSLPLAQPGSAYHSHQSGLQQARQRAAHWTVSETKAFVELWGDDCVQTALYDNYRNEAQYTRLSDRMGKLGFHRTLEQCRQRAKDLRRGFKEIKDGRLHSNRARQTRPFFALLDRFLVISRGQVIPKVCANRAKQKGRKSRSPREELPGEKPFTLGLSPGGSDLHQLPVPDWDCYARALGLPDCQLQTPDQQLYSQAAGTPGHKGQLPRQDPPAHVKGVPNSQLPRQDETSLPCAVGLPDFALRLQDRDGSIVPSCLQQQEMVLASLTAASSLWQETASMAPGRPASTAAWGSAPTWHPGKAPSSSAKRMRDLRLRRRRQRAAMAKVLLGASYRPSDRTVWSKTQKTDWWDNLLAGQFDNREWVRYFRMSREAVLELVEELRPILQREDTNMRAAIPVDKRVALTLWKLATSDSYRSVANQFGIGVSTASVIVMEVCEAICDVLLKGVVQLGDAQAVMGGFERAGFPNCLGVVDETHIPILCSPHGASAYINGKGLVSTVLQALVDSAGRFMDVYAGWSGGMQDCGLLWGSPLFERMENGTFGPQSSTEIEGVVMSPVLLGGPACPLRPWLMKPYAEASGGPRERFNAILGKCRVAVTYAFERLKGRWRCLLKRLDVAEKNVPLVIIACCILHNLCENRNEAMQDGWEEGMDRAEVPPATPEGPGDRCCDMEEAREAHRVREAYCAFFEKRQREEEP